MHVAVYSYRRHCRCRCRHYLSATFEESPEMISSFYKGNRRKRLYRRTDGKFTLDDKKKKEGGDLLNPGMDLERFSRAVGKWKISRSANQKSTERFTLYRSVCFIKISRFF